MLTVLGAHVAGGSSAPLVAVVRATDWTSLVPVVRVGAAVAALVVLVLAQVISYIKARAEASGLTADGGLVERAERLIIALVGTGLQGLGVAHAVEVALWLLAALSVLTLAQRMWSAIVAAREVQSP